MDVELWCGALLVSDAVDFLGFLVLLPPPPWMRPPPPNPSHPYHGGGAWQHGTREHIYIYVCVCVCVCTNGNCGGLVSNSANAY